MRRDMTRLVFGWLGCLLCLASVAACSAEAHQPESGAEALRRGDYESAIEFFTNRIDEEPADVQAHRGLVRAYRDPGVPNGPVRGERSGPDPAWGDL